MLTKVGPTRHFWRFGWCPNPRQEQGGSACRRIIDELDFGVVERSPRACDRGQIRWIKKAPRLRIGEVIKSCERGYKSRRKPRGNAWRGRPQIVCAHATRLCPELIVWIGVAEGGTTIPAHESDVLSKTGKLGTINATGSTKIDQQREGYSLTFKRHGDRFADQGLYRVSSRVGKSANLRQPNLPNP